MTEELDWDLPDCAQCEASILLAKSVHVSKASRAQIDYSPLMGIEPVT